ncbi:hypothetical protein AB0N62_43470 [Streptomyces sp. NPDC093982]|uniref:hypothetical protein n=1 Tax=Streptomyces sp. NPDC093982 TaxID=3155077 RepID=UPI0034375737
MGTMNSFSNPEERWALEGPAHDYGHESETPIYEALYAEYRGAFKALPGDRLGEEELRFQPFDPRLELPQASAAEISDPRAA